DGRQSLGECGLADAGWTCNQPGMGETATPISAKQRLLSLAVAVEHARLARGRRLEVVGFLDTHDTAPAGRLEMRAGSSRSTTVRHIHSATTGFASVASIATQRSGSAVPSWRYASRKASWKASDSASHRAVTRLPRRLRARAEPPS